MALQEARLGLEWICSEQQWQREGRELPELCSLGNQVVHLYQAWMPTWSPI
ncbi:hypothetical protein DPMN_038979 [Dreissena polymorpha]|uniref:Uncharacterized protein n=1 Tax=Dreissena polymorpha TaxID=45954 RepID=A0A9D4MF80_DREPO|nr:hypothetical protein DPMN_038979 [Dreissena polymorpha]